MKTSNPCRRLFAFYTKRTGLVVNNNPVAPTVRGDPKGLESLSPVVGERAPTGVTTFPSKETP
jgi:hypothetical protein